MLTPDETATIRAALRYWSEEMVPHGETVAQPYYDVERVRTLDRREVERLIDRFGEDQLRFVASPPERLLRRVDADAQRGQPLHAVIPAVS